MEVDAFLKEHGVFLQYTEEDLAHDREVASRIARTNGQCGSLKMKGA